MSDITTLECSPRQITKFTIRSLLAGKVPYIRSSPGMGKSSIVKSIANDYNLQLIDHRLSTSAPEDLTGLPKFETKVNPDTGETYDIAKFVPFETFPVEGTPLPNGKNGWILFLDEFNSANKSVQAAAYKLILDKQVGLYNLHPKVHIVCAGNLDTDRAIVNPLSTAMQSRLITLIMTINHEEFMKDVAYKYDWDERIIAYLSYSKDDLMDFRPDHNDKTFCCPRTWEFMNDLIKGQPVEDEDAPLYAGTITSGKATTFIQFTKVYNNLPKISDIIKNPISTPIPNDRSLQYATMIYLQKQVDDKNVDAISDYINRFSAEFKIAFFRGLLVRQPLMRQNPAFMKSILELNRYLND